MSDRALAALENILASGAEPDDVLTAVVALVAAEPGVDWAGIAFLEGEELVVGPDAGLSDESRRVRVPVTYEGARVGELWIDGNADPAFLDRVAELVASYVLIGWDTRGERWDP